MIKCNKRIALITIENINNIGDELLGSNTKYLVEKCFKKI